MPDQESVSHRLKIPWLPPSYEPALSQLPAAAPVGKCFFSRLLTSSKFSQHPLETHPSNNRHQYHSQNLHEVNEKGTRCFSWLVCCQPVVHICHEFFELHLWKPLEKCKIIWKAKKLFLAISYWWTSQFPARSSSLYHCQCQAGQNQDK